MKTLIPQLLRQRTRSGMTMLEILGAIGLVVILAAVAVPALMNTNKAGERSSVEYMVRLLNLAVEKYNQSGGSMTGEVSRGNTAGLAESELPEVQVVCRLVKQYEVISGTGRMDTSKPVGPFLPNYLRPVLSNDSNKYRAVWVNGQSDSNPGRFVLIGPDVTVSGVAADTLGIIELDREGSSCSGIIAESTVLIQGKEGEDAVYSDSIPSGGGSGMGGNTLSLSVASNGGGTVTPNTPTSSNSTITYSATAYPGYVFSHWGKDLAGMPRTGDIVLDTNKEGVAYFLPQNTTVDVVASPSEAGQANGSGLYTVGQTATLTATANPGWIFSGWSGDVISNNATEMVSVTAPVAATANFVADPSTVTVPDPITGATPTPTPAVTPTPTPIPTPTPAPSPSPEPTPTPGPTPTPVSGAPTLGGSLNLWGQGIVAFLGGNTDLRAEFTNTNNEEGLSPVIITVTLPEGLSFNVTPLSVIGDQGSLMTLATNNGQSATWVGSAAPREHIQILMNINGDVPGTYTATGNAQTNVGISDATRDIYVPPFYPLQMTAQVNPGQVPLGAYAALYIQVQNTNAITAAPMSGVTLTVDLPTGVTVDNLSASIGTASVIGNQLIWSGTMPPGTPLEINGQLMAATQGTYEIVTSVSGPVNPEGGTSETDTLTVTEPAAIPMGGELTHSSSSPLINSLVQISGLISSNSDYGSPVYVEFALPENLEFQSVFQDGGLTFVGSSVQGGQTILSFTGFLSPRGQTAPAINVRPRAYGPFTTTMRAGASVGMGDFTASTTLTVPAPAHSSLDFQVSPNPATVGAVTNFTATVTNGDQDIPTELIVTLPSQFQLGMPSASSGLLTVSGQTVRWAGTQTANNPLTVTIPATPTTAVSGSVTANLTTAVNTAAQTVTYAVNPAGVPFETRYHGKGNPWNIASAGISGDMQVQFGNQQASPQAYTVTITGNNAVVNTPTITGTAPQWGSVTLFPSFVSTGANPSFTIRIYRTGMSTPDLTYTINW